MTLATFFGQTLPKPAFPGAWGPLVHEYDGAGRWVGCSNRDHVTIAAERCARGQVETEVVYEPGTLTATCLAA